MQRWQKRGLLIAKPLSCGLNTDPCESDYFWPRPPYNWPLSLASYISEHWQRSSCSDWLDPYRYRRTNSNGLRGRDRMPNELTSNIVNLIENILIPLSASTISLPIDRRSFPSYFFLTNRFFKGVLLRQCH